MAKSTVSAFEVLSNLNLLQKVLERRGLQVTVKGQVWADELSSFVSAPEAYLAGIGKTRKTAAQQEVFDLLLLNVAGKEAVKNATLRQAELRDEGDNTQQLALDKLITLQERMGKGMALIQKANKDISARWADKQTAELLVKGKGLNRFSGYVYKAWSTLEKDRNEKQVKCLSHPNNQKLIAWFDFRAKLWTKWHELQAEAKALAEENNLWPMYYNIVRTSFATFGETRTEQSTKGTVVDVRLQTEVKYQKVGGKRTQVEYINLVLCVFDHVEVMEEDEETGLTGHWETDTMDDMLKSYLAEQVKLNAAVKAAEFGKKWVWPLKKDKHPAYEVVKLPNGKFKLVYPRSFETKQLIQAAKNRRRKEKFIETREAGDTSEFESFNVEYGCIEDDGYGDSLVQAAQLFLRE